MLRILHHRDNTALFTVLVTATTSGRRRVQTLVLLIKETRKMLLRRRVQTLVLLIRETRKMLLSYNDLGVAGSI